MGYHNTKNMINKNQSISKETLCFEDTINRRKKNPYEKMQKIYSGFSSSILLENKGSTARDHLANERTFLAWLRTSLSLITVGVAMTQLYHLTPQGVKNPIRNAKIGKAIGAVFVIFSVLFLYFANTRYFYTQISMTKGQFPASRGTIIFGSICTCVILVAVFTMVILDVK